MAIAAPPAAAVKAGSPDALALAPVRAVIPERCYRKSTARAGLVIARDVAVYAAALVGLALTDHPLLLVPLWIVAGLAVGGLFILGHDAAHGALFPRRWMNSVLGRLLMLPALHVYEAWVFGHNRVHHGHTVREGMDFVWHPVTPEQYAAMGRLARIRHRLEWSWLGSGAYYGRAIWWQKMIRFDPRGKHAAAIKRDFGFVLGNFAGASATIVLVGLLTGSSWLGALWLVVKLLVVPFALFIHVIGWTVYVHHVHPSIRWWPRREWNAYRGQLEGTTILRIPRALNLFFHNIFVHIPHHVDVRIPFHQLPRAAAAIKAHFGHAVIDKKLRLREFIATTRACKLYDFAAGRWMTYRDAREALRAAAA